MAQKKKRWLVAVAYVGECCNTPHVSLVMVQRETRDAAVGAEEERLRRRGYSVGEGLTAPRSWVR